MAEPIYVQPVQDGWLWHRGDKSSRAKGQRSKHFDTRSEAFEDALIERESEAVVLLREDGSVYGELYHEARAGGPPTRVDILAAATRDGAEGMG